MDIKSTLMKNILLLFSIFFILIIFVSCDPMSNYSTYVNNTTQSNIKVYVYSNYTLDPSLKPYDSLLVKSKTKGQLFNFTERSNAKICTNPKDSIVAQVVDKNELKVALDLNKESNYTSSGSKRIIECTVTIRDSDIVLK